MKAGTTTRTTSVWQRIVAVLLGLLVVSGSLFGVGSVANADDKEMSLYSVSSSVTAFFAGSTKPDAKDSEKPDSQAWGNIASKPSLAGGLLGFADKDINPFVWLISQATGATQTMDFTTIGKIGTGAKEYAQYGATLQAMGLDSTSTGLSVPIVQWIGGGLLLLPYWLALLVDLLFNLMIQILQFLNPFKLFYFGVQAISPDLADGMVGGSLAAEDIGPLAGLATFIGGIYQLITDLSWMVLIPLFIAITVFFMVLSKTSKGSLFKKLLVRMAFIVIGIPLLGSMYTNVLDELGEITHGANNGATQMVASTFVDFETWATDHRLAVPRGAVIEWDKTAKQPTAKSTINVQETALAINRMVHDSFDNLQNPFSMDDTDWQKVPSASDSSKQDTSSWLTATGMILRYMAGAQITSASYASDVQGQFIRKSDGINWFDSLVGDKLSSPDPAPTENPLLIVPSGGELTAKDDGRVVSFGVRSQSTADCSLVNIGTACAMSPLAVYNYLNTTFGEDSITTYSSNRAMSAATQQIHNSVTLVGSGMSSVIHWVNTLALLMAFVVIGIGYGIAMLIGNLKKGIQILTSTPFAMLGAMGAITKVVVFAIAMVLELIVTIFLFKVVQDFLMAIPKVFTHFFVQIFNFANGVFSGGIGALEDLNDGYAGVIIAILSPLISLIMVIALTIMAMRLRKSIVKAISEVATKIVESVLGTNSPTSPDMGGPGKFGTMAAAAAGGIGAGAGMALGGKMLGGDKGPQAGSVAGPAEASSSGAHETTIQGESGGGGDTAPSGGGGGSPVVPVVPGGGGGTAAKSSTTERGGELSQLSDTELGEKVEQKGLTANPQQGGNADGAQGSGAPREVGAGEDAMDTMANSMEHTNELQKQQAKEKREAKTALASGAVHAGLAVAHGYSGNAAGAVNEGTKALNSVSQAKSKQDQARQTKRQIDSPTPSKGGSTPAQRSQPTQPAQSVQPKPQPKQQSQPKSPKAPKKRSLPIAKGEDQTPPAAQ